MDFSSYATYLIESEKKDIKTKLIQLFKKDKLVTLADLEEFAKETGVDMKQVQYTIIEFLHNLLYKKYKPFKYDHDEYKKGIEDEKEHTKDEEIAKSIVLDHLRLHPNYYSELDKAGL
jgi:DNA polymerase III gamma/tau subunit